MTEKDLIRANEINKEINELELFISNAERLWEGKIIKETHRYIFKSISYGCLNGREYHMNTEIKNKVLNVLREHLEYLKNQLKSM